MTVIPQAAAQKKITNLKTVILQAAAQYTCMSCVIYEEEDKCMSRVIPQAAEHFLNHSLHHFLSHSLHHELNHQLKRLSYLAQSFSSTLITKSVHGFGFRI